MYLKNILKAHHEGKSQPREGRKCKYDYYNLDNKIGRAHV